MPPKGWRRLTGHKAPAVEPKEVEKVEEVAAPEPAVEVVVAEAVKPVVASDPITESRQALNQPLSPGQEFYEAPDGYIIVAETGRDHVWYRGGNDGKGMYINKRRA
jgi:hypothetical protein